MNEPIRGSVELTEADFVDAYLGHAAHTKSITSLRKVVGVVLLVTTLAVLFAWPPTPGVWVAMVLALAFAAFWARHQWVWIGRRTFAYLPEARRRFEMTFTDDGVRAKGSRAEVFYAWSTLVGWIETGAALVLLGPAGVSDFVPKRAFDEEQLEALRALFAEKIVPMPAAAVAPQPKGRSWKGFALWVLLILMFVAIYQLVVER